MQTGMADTVAPWGPGTRERPLGERVRLKNQFLTRALLVRCGLWLVGFTVYIVSDIASHTTTPHAHKQEQARVISAAPMAGFVSAIWQGNSKSI